MLVVVKQNKNIFLGTSSVLDSLFMYESVKGRALDYEGNFML